MVVLHFFKRRAGITPTLQTEVVTINNTVFSAGKARIPTSRKHAAFCEGREGQGYLPGLDGDVGGLPPRLAARLVEHDARVGQSRTVSLFPRGQQHGSKPKRLKTAHDGKNKVTITKKNRLTQSPYITTYNHQQHH